MPNGKDILVLLFAAFLEAGGDAIVRIALHTTAVWPRFLLFSASAAVLFSYGYLVNAPAWDFGRLLGLYVVFFFAIAQLISWLGFKQPPSNAVLMGGAFIMIGGGIIAFAKG
jgi:small multidrug resistance family-3 protein